MVASLNEHLHRLADHARRFAGLELTAVPSAAVSDDDNDNEYTGDMRHLTNMLDELAHACATTHGATVEPLGQVHSTILELVLEEVRFDWDAPDEAADAIRAWRAELKAMKNFTRWWLAESKRDHEAAQAAA